MCKASSMLHPSRAVGSDQPHQAFMSVHGHMTSMPVAVKRDASFLTWVASVQDQDRAKRERMDEVSLFLSDCQLPKPLQLTLTSFYRKQELKAYNFPRCCEDLSGPPVEMHMPCSLAASRAALPGVGVGLPGVRCGAHESLSEPHMPAGYFRFCHTACA